MDRNAPPVAAEVKTWRAKQLRAARLAASLTQVQLAERVEVEQNTISRFERESDPATPNVPMQIKLAVALGVRVEDIFGWPYGVNDMARYQLPELVPDEAA